MDNDAFLSEDEMTQYITVYYVKDDVDSDLRYEVTFSRADDPNFSAIKTIQLADGYLKVAQIEYDDHKTLGENLERAWKLLQNGVITDSWTLSPPDGLLPLVQPHVHNGQNYGHRSASMGDMFEFNDKKYVVAMVGFKELL